MTRVEDQCVGCPTEMGCLGQACPNRNVRIVICDDCGDTAICNIEGQDFCENCAEHYVNSNFELLELSEKARLLEMNYYKIDN